MNEKKDLNKLSCVQSRGKEMEKMNFTVKSVSFTICKLYLKFNNGRSKTRNNLFTLIKN